MHRTADNCPMQYFFDRNFCTKHNENVRCSSFISPNYTGQIFPRKLYVRCEPVWKERISYARYFLLAFSSHANSYYRDFQYYVAHARGNWPQTTFWVCVYPYTVANYLLVVKSETSNYFRSA